MTQPIEIKSIFNPTDEDLNFKYDSAEYVLKAGEKKDFVAHICFHAAKKLADKNVKTSNPDEHKVLTAAYLENSSPEDIAKRLGVDLAKIRKNAEQKEKEKARIINLESIVMEQNKKIEELMKRTEKEEVKEVKIDKRTKEYKTLNK